MTIMNMIADIDECQDASVCPTHSDCVNSRASYQCVCHSGFEMHGDQCTGKLCNKQGLNLNIVSSKKYFLNMIVCLQSIYLANQDRISMGLCKTFVNTRLVQI